jgi:hypothetical protein
MHPKELIDQAFDRTMKEAELAVQRRDVAAATALMRKATEYQDLKKSLISVEERLKGLESQPVTATAEAAGDGKLRELPVEVTGGMIRQNLLTLTKHVKQRRIAVGEDLTIETQPSGERFRTELLLKGNKLQERGAIARFYRDAGVHDGDFVVLTEVAPKRWTLTKASPGRYQSRRSILAAL